VRAGDAVGRFGEQVAVAHLEADGMRVLARNWRCPLGEIDVVALDGDCLVVCEVKTRRSAVCGPPAESVTRAKVARLRRLAAHWLAAQPSGYAEVRLDVLAVRCPPGGEPVVAHLRGVA